MFYTDEAPARRGGGTHWAEIRVVASYDYMAKHLTTLMQVKSGSGTAGGRTIYPLRKDPTPEDFMIIKVELVSTI